MKNINRIDQLNNNGTYKYIGFMANEPTTFKGEKDGKENAVLEVEILGSNYHLFSDEKDNLFHIISTRFIGANVEKPFGCFTKYMSNFNSNIEFIVSNNGIDVKENGVKINLEDVV